MNFSFRDTLLRVSQGDKYLNYVGKLVLNYSI